MERLRDHLRDPDPDSALAARLLASGDVEELTDERAARIERSVRRRSRAAARPWWLQSAVVAAAVLGIASVALASSPLLREFVQRWLSSPSPPSAPAVSASREAAEPEAARRPPSAPVLSEPPATAPAAPATASAAASVTATASGAPAARPARSPDPVAVLRRQPRNLETAVLQNAVNSLRRDHEPERAAMFLTFYMDRYRDGRFIEEAFALAIEVAEARHAAEAPLVARRYLQRFPRGRYHLLAERATHKHQLQP